MSRSASRINISLRRGDFRLKVDFELPDEGITAILGPSGSGKSSLLRAVAGLERPESGRIEIGGRIWYDAESRCFLPPQQRRVGMVFQDYALFEHKTVAANVGYGLPRWQRKASVALWLERLHLEDAEDRYPKQLSGGQRQRVA
ncbi:MAG: ATP-binding cassette domain-containing protein, partial [Gammaproteobacteria bacterium]